MIKNLESKIETLESKNNKEEEELKEKIDKEALKIENLSNKIEEHKEILDNINSEIIKLDSNHNNNGKIII